eukprot:2872832-Amphidinium_carterae.1
MQPMLVNYKLAQSELMSATVRWLQLTPYAVLISHWICDVMYVMYNSLIVFLLRELYLAVGCLASCATCICMTRLHPV